MCVGAFRADFVVADCVVVEAKASALVNESHRKQLINYIRCSALEVGLLLHFGPKATFQRIVYTNDHKLGLPLPK
jgi:GxxExxY protein